MNAQTVLVGAIACAAGTSVRIIRSERRVVQTSAFGPAKLDMVTELLRRIIPRAIDRISKEVRCSGGD